jgi:hypothetical protein
MKAHTRHLTYIVLLGVILLIIATVAVGMLAR